MSVLAGTSILRDLLGFMSSTAQGAFSRFERNEAPADDLKHELGAFLAIALAAYDEIRALTAEATSVDISNATPDIVLGVRDAHRAFIDACQPVLRLVGWARRSGAEPRRLDSFMSALGEANLIANRYARVIESDHQADAGRTRTLEDVRDELRRRIHPGGR
jgi:hypothetical protein